MKAGGDIEKRTMRDSSFSRIGMKKLKAEKMRGNKC